MDIAEEERSNRIIRIYPDVDHASEDDVGTDDRAFPPSLPNPPKKTSRKAAQKSPPKTRRIKRDVPVVPVEDPSAFAAGGIFSTPSYPTYGANDVKPTDDGLFRFQDEQDIIATARAALAAAHTPGYGREDQSLPAMISSTAYKPLSRRTATAQMLLDLMAQGGEG